nr:MAG TPA: hypothetical protein [Caudoviricetes sp.]
MKQLIHHILHGVWWIFFAEIPFENRYLTINLTKWRELR